VRFGISGSRIGRVPEEKEIAMPATLQPAAPVAKPLPRAAVDPKPGSRRRQPQTRPPSDLDQGLLLKAQALALADDLEGANSLSERVLIYATAERRVLFAAAALHADRMPLLNGELEWIALASADVE